MIYYFRKSYIRNSMQSFIQQISLFNLFLICSFCCGMELTLPEDAYTANAKKYVGILKRRLNEKELISPVKEFLQERIEVADDFFIGKITDKDIGEYEFDPKLRSWRDKFES